MIVNIEYNWNIFSLLLDVKERENSWDKGELNIKVKSQRGQGLNNFILPCTNFQLGQKFQNGSD